MGNGREKYILVKYELRDKKDTGRMGWECAHLRKPSQSRLREELAECSRRGTLLCKQAARVCDKASQWEKKLDGLLESLQGSSATSWETN